MVGGRWRQGVMVREAGLRQRRPGRWLAAAAAVMRWWWWWCCSEAAVAAKDVVVMAGAWRLLLLWRHALRLIRGRRWRRKGGLVEVGGVLLL